MIYRNIVLIGVVALLIHMVLVGARSYHHRLELVVDANGNLIKKMK